MLNVLLIFGLHESAELDRGLYPSTQRACLLCSGITPATNASRSCIMFLASPG